MKKKWENSIFDVAHYILNKLGYTSTMKLQKLCYYSQAYSLVKNNKELFPEDFQAWVNGPVCKELYEVHKNMFIINSDILNNRETKEVSKEGKECIDTVLLKMSNFSGNELSQITHKESPWKTLRKPLKKDEKSDAIITKESIKKYYSSKQCKNILFV